MTAPRARCALRARLAASSLVLVLVLGAGTAGAASRPPVRGAGGAVASDELDATAVGLATLRAGGNAVDAAIAAALALAVVGPEAGNLGGGGFAVVKLGDEVAALDFRETAPAAAHRTMYLDVEGRAIPKASTLGPLAAGVPGSPAGYYELHKQYGRLPWAQVVEPARKLAADGFVVSQRTRLTLHEARERLAAFPETAAVWLPGGAPPPQGYRMRLPTLAATLERYAALGPAGISGGSAAQAIEAAAAKYGGVLKATDLAAYRPEWRPPLRYEAFGWQLASADLPAAGGIVIAAAARLLDDLGWREAPRFGAQRAHLLTEALRRVSADRFLLADPATTRARAADLLDPRWLAKRLATVDRARATPSDQVLPWQGEPREGADTTHLSVVDREGRMVSLTTTLNDLYGCALWVPEVGFFLNNEMDDFATAPGQPNLFGLIQGEANAVGPGKRMLSSQAPTIAWRMEQGRQADAIALGGRGGSRIPTAVLQVLLNVWLDGDGLQAAIDRPRIHHQWRPDQISHEADALAPETQQALIALGHRLAPMAIIGQTPAVRAVRAADGSWTLEAASDPRSGGGAAGVVEPWP